MKRDEALLKKTLEESNRLKKQVANQKTHVQERLIVQPVAMAGVKATRSTGKAGEQVVPDADTIKN